MLGTPRFTLCGKGQYLILTGSITPTYQRLQGMFRSHCEVISVTIQQDYCAYLFYEDKSCPGSA